MKHQTTNETGAEMQNYRKESKGEIVMMWKGKNDTYWCQMRRWIGTGYVYVDYEVDFETYDVWSA